MGNRAVIEITEKGVHSDANVGIYLHWNGGRDSVEGFLAAAREVMKGREGDNQYATARLIQCATAFFPGNLSIGVGVCGELDCDNWDNGVYLVNPRTLQITGREYQRHAEQSTHNPAEIAAHIIARINAGVAQVPEN